MATFPENTESQATPLNMDGQSALPEAGDAPSNDADSSNAPSKIPQEYSPLQPMGTQENEAADSDSKHVPTLAPAETPNVSESAKSDLGWVSGAILVIILIIIGCIIGFKKGKIRTAGKQALPQFGDNDKKALELIKSLAEVIKRT